MVGRWGRHKGRVREERVGWVGGGRKCYGSQAEEQREQVWQQWGKGGRTRGEGGGVRPAVEPEEPEEQAGGVATAGGGGGGGGGGGPKGRVSRPWHKVVGMGVAAWLAAIVSSHT